MASKKCDFKDYTVSHLSILENNFINNQDIFSLKKKGSKPVQSNLTFFSWIAGLPLVVLVTGAVTLISFTDLAVYIINRELYINKINSTMKNVALIIFILMLTEGTRRVLYNNYFSLTKPKTKRFKEKIIKKPNNVWVSEKIISDCYYQTKTTTELSTVDIFLKLQEFVGQIIHVDVLGYDEINNFNILLEAYLIKKYESNLRKHAKLRAYNDLIVKYCGEIPVNIGAKSAEESSQLMRKVLEQFTISEDEKNRLIQSNLIEILETSSSFFTTQIQIEKQKGEQAVDLFQETTTSDITSEINNNLSGRLYLSLIFILVREMNVKNSVYFYNLISYNMFTGIIMTIYTILIGTTMNKVGGTVSYMSNIVYLFYFYTILHIVYSLLTDELFSENDVIYGHTQNFNKVTPKEKFQQLWELYKIERDKYRPENQFEQIKGVDQIEQLKEVKNIKTTPSVWNVWGIYDIVSDYIPSSNTFISIDAYSLLAEINSLVVDIKYAPSLIGVFGTYMYDKYTDIMIDLSNLSGLVGLLIIFHSLFVSYKNTKQLKRKKLAQINSNIMPFTFSLIEIDRKINSDGGVPPNIFNSTTLDNQVASQAVQLNEINISKVQAAQNAVLSTATAEHTKNEKEYRMFQTTQVAQPQIQYTYVEPVQFTDLIRRARDMNNSTDRSVKMDLGTSAVISRFSNRNKNNAAKKETK